MMVRVIQGNFRILMESIQFRFRNCNILEFTCIGLADWSKKSAKTNITLT